MLPFKNLTYLHCLETKSVIILRRVFVIETCFLIKSSFFERIFHYISALVIGYAIITISHITIMKSDVDY